MCFALSWSCVIVGEKWLLFPLHVARSSVKALWGQPGRVDEAKWLTPGFPLCFTHRNSAFEVLWNISLKKVSVLKKMFEKPQACWERV